MASRHIVRQNTCRRHAFGQVDAQGSIPSDAFAWARANAWGGRSYGGWGGTTHVNRFGGSTSSSWDGAWSHTSVDGCHACGVYGYGAVHTGPGGASFYGPR